MAFGLDSMLGGLGGLFGALSWKNPADAANPYLQGIQGQMSPYLNPYMQAGGRAMGTLESQFNRGIQDPTSIMKQIGSTYQQSPGYQYNLNQAQQGVNNAAAAGGYVGTPQAQQQMADVTSGLASRDYNQYMNMGMGSYNQGLQGMQGINQMGYGASQQMADAAMQQLMAQAKNAYYGQGAENENNSSMWGGLGSIASGLLAFL